MAVVNREDNCYHPSLQSFTTKFFRRDVFVCCHFSNSHSLFNPMQSTSALCLFWKCIHKVTNDLSLLQIPYWHCPTLTFCPLWSTCLDDHSFSLRFSLHLDTLQSPGSFCLAVRFCEPLFLGWSHHCQCPVLGLLSISLHVYSLGISSAPTASNAIHVCFLKNLYVQAGFVPWAKDLTVQMHSASSLGCLVVHFNSKNKAKSIISFPQTYSLLSLFSL